MNLRGAAAIVGIGETKVGKVPGSTCMSLQVEAARKAVADAGLRMSDIDAVYVKTMNEEPVFLYSITFCEYMGIRAAYSAAMDAGGSTCVTMLAHAVAGIATGLFTTALCVAGAPDATFRKRLPNVGMYRGGEETGEPFGMFGAIPEYALVTRRHMAEYGTTSEQLAAVAVAARKHASLNENAQMRAPITVDDVLSSRWICEPLHLLDCSLVTDGAGAFVVTSAERATDLRQPPAYVLGLGGMTTHRIPSQVPLDSRPPAYESGKQAYAMAGLGPSDVDVAELYDCFTITTLVQLENLGFCEPGEGGAFVEHGRIELGGELPVNTHGGLLSQGHVDGMLHVLEGTRQVRRHAGARQVPDCEVALVTGNGGTLSSHNAAILGRAR